MSRTPRPLLALAALVVAHGASAALLRDLAADHDRLEAAVAEVAGAVLADAGRPTPAVAEAPEPVRPPLLVFAAIRPVTADRLATVEDLLDDWDDDRAERLRAHFEATDPARTATDLLGDERHDRWAAAVNDTIRPFGLGTNLLAVVNPILLAGSAVDSVLSAATHVRDRHKTSLREHEALAAYGTAAALDPSGRLGPDDARAARRLDERVRRHTCRRLAHTVEAADEADRLEEAVYLLRSPAARGCARELEEPREDLEARLAERRRLRTAARWPATEPRLPRTRGEWDAYGAIAVATVTADPAAMIVSADRFAVTYADGPNAVAARLVAGTAHAMAGRPDAARDRLEEVEDGDGTAALVARERLALLDLADAEGVEAAERQHARDVARYVLIGGSPSGTGLVRTAIRTGTQGLGGLMTLGIANVVGLVTRGVLAWRRDPASNETLIAEGESYLARHPNGARAVDVRKRLVRAYERSERWHRALMHYQALPDADAERVRELKDEIATSMLERAKADPDDLSLLRAVVLLYPASDAADRAREILEAHDTGRGVPIPRDVLAEVPWLLGSTGLGLPAGLLDGDEDNGELADEGIRVTPYAIECSLEADGDELHTDTIPLGEDDAPRVLATLSEIARIHRVTHADDDGEKRGRWEDWIPFFVQGSVGDSGVGLQPGIKLRSYDPAHPERFR